MLSRNDLDERQLAAIAFASGGEDTLLVADIGTGKTVIAYTVMLDALRAGRVKRWLVAAPLMVAEDTWRNEFLKWTHLHNLHVTIACGSAANRSAIIDKGSDITVINYENLAWLFKEYPNLRGTADTLPFDGLVCDEIDKLKDISSNRFKQIRNRIKHFRMRIGMTGSILPNELTEIWGQAYMVDAGQSFADDKLSDGTRVGRSFIKWRRKYFFPVDYKQYDWRPFSDSEKRIIARLSGLAFRLPAQGLPQVVRTTPYMLNLPDGIRKLYTELEREYVTELADAAGNVHEIDAINSGTLKGKLQQICAGFSYIDDNPERDAIWHSYDKYEWLEGLHRSLGLQLLVVYYFNEELNELKRRYPGIPYLGAGLSATKKCEIINRWNHGFIPLLPIHAQSAGHGLNLQLSGAHHIAFLTQPWSGGLWSQVVGRLARLGQAARQVFVHTALYRNTVDEEVDGIVREKIRRREYFNSRLEQ